jgi:hypothetical protein
MMLRICKAVAGHCRGFWNFLVHRQDRRRDVELERERNAGTRSAIEALSSAGGQLIEIEREGRSRMIWMPTARSTPTRAVAQHENPPSVGELPQWTDREHRHPDVQAFDDEHSESVRGYLFTIGTRRSSSTTS